MREILFRGKKKPWGGWAEGSLVKMRDYYRISEKNDMISFGVETETIGQFTGLTDKNGKKIFDGDVVKIFLRDGEDVGVIKWSDIGARFKFASSDGCAYGIDCTTAMQVIGNIHDNPELLEG